MPNGIIAAIIFFLVGLYFLWQHDQTYRESLRLGTFDNPLVVRVRRRELWIGVGCMLAAVITYFWTLDIVGFFTRTT